MTDHWQFHGLLPEAKALHEILEQALPGNRIEPVSFSADERRVIIFSESDRDPGSYYLLDRKTNEMSSIGTRQPQLQSIRPVQTKFFFVSGARWPSDQRPHPSSRQRSKKTAAGRAER